MNPEPNSKIEFIAKTITDLGKAMVVAGFVSYFFERFPLALRIVFSISSVALILLGIILYPNNANWGGNL